MQIFEDVLYKKDEYTIIGFINSSRDLEYSTYKCEDGGFLTLEDREYNKNELSDLLEIELAISIVLFSLNVLSFDFIVAKLIRIVKLFVSYLI